MGNLCKKSKQNPNQNNTFNATNAVSFSSSQNIQPEKKENKGNKDIKVYFTITIIVDFILIICCIILGIIVAKIRRTIQIAQK